MMKTAITEMFGIKYPVICGSMMWLCTPGLCVAISEAGGLGNLTCGNYETEDEFRAAIAEVRSLTSKPFFVGLTLIAFGTHNGRDEPHVRARRSRGEGCGNGGVGRPAGQGAWS